MWNVSGIETIQEGMSWQCFEQPDTVNDEGIYLSFGIHGSYNAAQLALEGIPSECIASLQNDIKANNIGWLQVTQHEWKIHLDELKVFLKQYIHDINAWGWFSGKAFIEPQYKVYENGGMLFASVTISPSTVNLLEMFTKIVKDQELAEVLSLRWQESKRTLDAEACLSTIVLLGSIAEGVLLSKLQDNKAIAEAQPSAPLDKKRGGVIQLEKWRFNVLIKVAYECEFISRIVKDCMILVKDYRNLVHPKEQQRQQFFPDVKTCEMIRNAVESVILHFSR